MSSAAKCLQQLSKSVFKDQKTACATTGDAEAECSDFYTNENGNTQISITAAANQGSQACDVREDPFWDFCTNGFPAP